MKELEKIKDFIDQLLKHLGYLDDEFEVNLKEEDDLIEVKITIPEPDSGIVIGRGGEVLLSIQKILRLVFLDKIDKKIRVDVNEYKKKKQEKLKEVAREVANQVKNTGKSRKINRRLSSYERFIIHNLITEEFPELTSKSSGEGLARVVEIKPKEARDD